MRTFTSIFIVLLGVCGHGRGPTASRSKEVGGCRVRGAVLRRARRTTRSTTTDWYFEGRYAAAIAHYWTENLKTERRVRDKRRRVDLPARFDRAWQSAELPYSVESFHRLEQVSARMVWQFGTNRWAHPYVSGGVVGDRERRRIHIPDAIPVRQRAQQRADYPGSRDRFRSRRASTESG